MTNICCHCSNPIKATKIIYNGKEFCCNGCLTVYQLLSEENFLRFYEKKGTVPLLYKPEEIPENLERIYDEAVISKFIYKENGEMRISLIIDGITCSACIWLIEKIIGKIKGVKSFRISHTTDKGLLFWNPEEIKLSEIIKKVFQIGYKVYLQNLSTFSEKQKKYENELLIKLGTAFFLMMNIMIISLGLYAGYFQGIPSEYKNVFQYILFFLTTPIVFYSGFPFIHGTYVSLKQKSLNMDVLITLSVISSYLYSAVVTILGRGEVYFETPSAIIFFILLGRYIEIRIKSGGADFIEKMLKIVPKEAARLKNEKEEIIPVFAIEKGDTIKVKPSEIVPADGVIIQGVSHFDESFLTGESLPILKDVNCEVYAGAVNLEGMVIIKVTRKSSDMLVSKIARLVEEAELSKAPVERIADKLSGYFTSFIIITFLAVISFWYLKTGDISQALTYGISVLIISCPCALGIATPTAVHACINKAASNGIFIKSGAVIENLSKANKIFFDKTGTITTGKIDILKVISKGKISKDEILLTASSLEANSSHPIAKAFKYSNPLAVSDFTEITGAGVSGKINGVKYYLGSIALLKSKGIYNVPIEETYKSSIFLFNETEVLGIIIFGDKLKEEVLNLFKELNEIGLLTAIISGDSKYVVKEIAENLNVKEYYGEMMPEEKLALINNSKAKGYKVLMIGDGINDTPSLKSADVSIAVSSAVERVIEVSDVIFTKNDLTLLIKALKIAKKGFQKIKQNLIFASIYNLVAIPLAASGFLLPVFSAIAMVLSSITVVANSAKIRELQI